MDQKSFPRYGIPRYFKPNQRALQQEPSERELMPAKYHYQKQRQQQ